MNRRHGHAFVGVAFWLVFALLWVDLVLDGAVTASTVTRTLLVIGGIAVVVAAINAAWIRHNVSLYRRLGPRSGTPPEPCRSRADRLGRPILWTTLGGRLGATELAHLVVELDNGGMTKRYRAAQDRD